MKKIKQIVTSFIITLLFLLKVSTIHAEIININGATIETDGYITATLQDENKLYIGGNISSVNVNNTTQINRNNVAEVNITDAVVTDWNPQIDGPVHDLALFNDILFISGQFKTFNEQQKQYIVVVDSNTKEIIDLPITVNQPVYSLAVDQNMLYFGGFFTEVNGEVRNYIASYAIENNSLSQWSPKIDNTVYDIFIFENNIYIGGAFTVVDGQERNHLAAFNLSDGTLTDWRVSTDLIITHIEEQNNQIVVTGFSLLGEEVVAKRLYIHPVTGMHIKEEDVTIDDPVATQLFQQSEPVESNTDLMVDQDKLGFIIPSLADILTFAIRAFFAIAGLAALFFLLLGAFAWVTSGGDADAVGAAQQKIQAAIVGLLMMVFVLAIVWTLEQVIFNSRICLGLSCPLTIPSLLEPSE